jgi:hypothetical protein
MRFFALAAASVALLTTPALAQSDSAWEPCLTGDFSMEGVIAAFQADGWAFPTSNEEHIGYLEAAAEPLSALQDLPKAETGATYDKHLSNAHQLAERQLIDAATLHRDGVSVAIETYESMIRCTLSGTAFDEVSTAFQERADEITTTAGHQTLPVQTEATSGRSDITLYRLDAPADATIEARSPLAAIVIRHQD